jgi:hypothetical protein
MNLVDLYRQFFSDLDPTAAAFTHYVVMTNGDERAASNLLLASVLANGSAPPREEPKPSTTMNPADVAKQLKVSPATVIGWIRSGQLKAANLAKGPRPRYVVQRDDLNAFLKMRQPEPPAQRRRQAAKRSDDRY